MTANLTTEARRVLYSGRVQGVGFRYTARRIAQGHAVTGFVRNLADGRVELVAEGTAADLDQLLAAIAETMADNIRQTDVQKGPATGHFHSFEIATDQ
jgi:acylphosphatase